MQQLQRHRGMSVAAGVPRGVLRNRPLPSGSMRGAAAGFRHAAGIPRTRQAYRRQLDVRAIIERSFSDEMGVVKVGDVVTKDVLALALGGGSGDKLFPLTKRRSEPAIMFSGAYRLIDVPLSNALNSGIRKVYVLTQYNSQSLNRHVARAFNVDASVAKDSYIEILAAQQTPEGGQWFQGTADAIRQFVWLLEDIKNRNIEHVVVLAADQLYRMDYMRLVQHHVLCGAQVTVAATRVTEERAPYLGLLKSLEGSSGRVVDFAEKPTGARLEEMRLPQAEPAVLEYEELGGEQDKGNGASGSLVNGMNRSGPPRPFMASMGIYCFDKRHLIRLLKTSFGEAHDLGRDILPTLVKKGGRVFAYEHTGYWEDVGSIKLWFDANLEIAADSQNFNLFDPRSPLYTSQRFLPPAKLQQCSISEAMIGNGSVLERCTVHHAVVGIRTRIGEGTVVQDAVINGSDFYESEDLRQRILATGRVPVGIGANCRISNTILDKNCRIGAGCVLVNQEGVQEADREEEGWYIREGILVVGKDIEVPAGTII